VIPIGPRARLTIGALSLGGVAASESARERMSYRSSICSYADFAEPQSSWAFPTRTDPVSAPRGIPRSRVFLRGSPFVHRRRERVGKRLRWRRAHW
jgi:hypothetical protein